MYHFSVCLWKSSFGELLACLWKMKRWELLAHERHVHSFHMLSLAVPRSIIPPPVQMFGQATKLGFELSFLWLGFFGKPRVDAFNRTCSCIKEHAVVLWPAVKSEVTIEFWRRSHWGDDQGLSHLDIAWRRVGETSLLCGVFTPFQTCSEGGRFGCSFFPRIRQCFRCFYV